MTKIFAALAVLLILSGVLVLALPKTETGGSGPRGLAPAAQTTSALATIRSLAEQANAPLSIVFGLVSLFYSRRTYLNSQRMVDRK
jgi:hypothetical protein